MDIAKITEDDQMIFILFVDPVCLWNEDHYWLLLHYIRQV